MTLEEARTQIDELRATLNYHAEKYYNEVMSIPLYYGLTDDDVEDVIHAVKKVVAYYTKLK